jgi:hypothetical protein
MADNDDVSRAPNGDAAPTEPTRPVLPPDSAAAAAAPQPVLRQRWRDRAWSFRAMLAVALATLLLGGIVGGIVVAVADDDHDDHPRMGHWGPGMRVPPGWREPRRFDEGGPRWRWEDGPRQPDSSTAPFEQPSPSTPSPSE